MIIQLLSVSFPIVIGSENFLKIQQSVPNDPHDELVELALTLRIAFLPPH